MNPEGTAGPARNAYLNERGLPCLRDSIVAFIDVLGFSQLSISSADLAELQNLLNKINEAIQDSRRYARETRQEYEFSDEAGWSAKFFSDNLAFGYPLGDSESERCDQAWFILRCAQRYQLKMTLNGFFVRGALTQGPVCLTDEIIFGSALIDSYQLESQAAIVPRIIVAKPLERLLLESLKPAHGEHLAANESLCRDVDGWWFVNYLQAARNQDGVCWELIEQHKRSILESLSHTTRHDVLSKYGWACRYHNVFCHWNRLDPEYADSYRIDRRDEESSILNLKDYRR